MLAFWLVMRRVDRREDATVREREARVRRRVFAIKPGASRGASGSSTPDGGTGPTEPPP